MSNLIEIKNLHKTYLKGVVPTKALRGVSLDISAGTFACITGPSGHGKSTLLHLMGGLDKPDKGSVRVAGQEIYQLPDKELARFRAEKLGFVFQFFNLLHNLSVLENVQIPMMFTKVPKEEQEEIALKLLTSVGLKDKVRSRATELSGGQMQRVAIARALANDPEVLLMDEPTGNLDSSAEKEVMDIVARLHEKGKTIIIVTHEKEISHKAERIIRIKDGCLDRQ
jgi:putative ABC transport system ATP-binding protein